MQGVDAGERGQRLVALRAWHNQRGVEHVEDGLPERLRVEHRLDPRRPRNRPRIAARWQAVFGRGPLPPAEPAREPAKAANALTRRLLRLVPLRLLVRRGVLRLEDTHLHRVVQTRRPDGCFGLVVGRSGEQLADFFAARLVLPGVPRPLGRIDAGPHALRAGDPAAGLARVPHEERTVEDGALDRLWAAHLQHRDDDADVVQEVHRPVGGPLHIPRRAHAGSRAARADRVQ